MGRTRTAPSRGAATQRLAFAFASCQNYPVGYYTSHANLAREDLDIQSPGITFAITGPWRQGAL